MQYCRSRKSQTVNIPARELTEQCIDQYWLGERQWAVLVDPFRRGEHMNKPVIIWYKPDERCLLDNARNVQRRITLGAEVLRPIWKLLYRLNKVGCKLNPDYSRA